MINASPGTVRPPTETADVFEWLAVGGGEQARVPGDLPTAVRRLPGFDARPAGRRVRQRSRASVPSEPVCGQDAPPRASTTADARARPLFVRAHVPETESRQPPAPSVRRLSSRWLTWKSRPSARAAATPSGAGARRPAAPWGRPARSCRRRFPRPGRRPTHAAPPDRTPPASARQRSEVRRRNARRIFRTGVPSASGSARPCPRRGISGRRWASARRAPPGRCHPQPAPRRRADPPGRRRRRPRSRRRQTPRRAEVPCRRRYRLRSCWANRIPRVAEPHKFQFEENHARPRLERRSWTWTPPTR